VSTADDFLDAIDTRPLPAVASEFILDRLPHVFGSREVHLGWKEGLAATLGVDPCELIVVGSAATGVSLNPNKSSFKPFDSKSDVDVAVISYRHFDSAWEWMRRLGSGRFKLPLPAQTAFQEHVTRHVFYGVIATDKILAWLPFGSDWMPGLALPLIVDPVSGRDVNVRLYRDFSALRNYQLIGLRKARQRRLDTSTGGT
jgi:hypothetical protein